MTFGTKLTQLTGAAALGLATALTPVALPVSAQENGAEEPGIAYTDEVLGNFVDAAMSVSEVRNEFAPRLQNADSEQAAQQLAQEAVLEMRAAVEGTDGIDVATYTAIGEAAQQDEDLAARITAIVQDRQGGEMPDGGDTGSAQN